MVPLGTGRGTLGIRGALVDRKACSGLNRLMIYTNGLTFVYKVKTSRFHKRRHLLSNLGITHMQQIGDSQPVLTQ